MLPFNFSFKRRNKRSVDYKLLKEFEDVSAFYYQLYLEKLGRTSKTHPQLGQCKNIVKGLTWYNGTIWKKLGVEKLYKKYIKSRQYSYKIGGIIQITNLKVLFKYYLTTKKQIL